MNSKSKRDKTNLLPILIVFLLFLGFSPINNPHLFGKIKWLMGGAVGMKPMDWFDLFMHGGSLVLALILLARLLVSFRKGKG